MSNPINSIDDLFDDQIGKFLRRLGYSFPKSEADFKQIESHIKMNKAVEPERLKNPYTFLGKRSFSRHAASIPGDGQTSYSQDLSQAAREGKNISEEIRKKMTEDKLKANRNKNEN